MVTDAASFQAATGANETQMADLHAFLARLTDWNGRMNLVGPSALAEFWLRHAWDSAQLLRFGPYKTWADLGAGAGFPGLVLAILLKGTPGAEVQLIESMVKRCRFLSETVADLAIPAKVHNARAEAISLSVEAVTARAVAPVAKLLGYARPYLNKGAVGLFLKGQDVEVELAEATKYWKFRAELKPSLSHSAGRILQVRGPIRAV